jgi:hypothetical protein
MPRVCFPASQRLSTNFSSPYLLCMNCIERMKNILPAKPMQKRNNIITKEFNEKFSGLNDNISMGDL